MYEPFQLSSGFNYTRRPIAHVLYVNDRDEEYDIDLLDYTRIKSAYIRICLYADILFFTLALDVSTYSIPFNEGLMIQAVIFDLSIMKNWEDDVCVKGRRR